MNKLLKIILISIQILSVVAGLATVGYFFGYKTLEAKLMQKGFNIAVGQIMQTAQQTGQVQLSKDLILVDKTQCQSGK